MFLLDLTITHNVELKIDVQLFFCGDRMKLQIVPIEQVIEEFPELFCGVTRSKSYQCNRRDALASIGTLLLAGLSPTVVLSTQANAGFYDRAAVWLERVSAAKSVWDVGSSIYGYCFGSNEHDKSAVGVIVINLEVDGILADQASVDISVLAGKPFSVRFETAQVSTQGKGFVRAHSLENSATCQISIV